MKIHEFTILTNDHIYAISQQSLSSDIVFSLEKSSVTPYGKTLNIFLIIKIAIFLNRYYVLLLCFVGSFFKAANNSNKHKKITSARISFIQKDIDDKLIFYKHFDNLTTTVTIPIKVSFLYLCRSFCIVFQFFRKS